VRAGEGGGGGRVQTLFTNFRKDSVKTERRELATFKEVVAGGKEEPSVQEHLRRIPNYNTHRVEERKTARWCVKQYKRHAVITGREVRGQERDRPERGRGYGCGNGSLLSSASGRHRESREESTDISTTELVSPRKRVRDRGSTSSSN